MAISALQCALLEHQARLRTSRLSNDGGHQSGPLRTNGASTQLPDCALLRTDVQRPDRPEQLGVRLRFAAGQSVFNLPGLEIQAKSERQNVQNSVQIFVGSFARSVGLSFVEQKVKEERSDRNDRRIVERI